MQTSLNVEELTDDRRARALITEVAVAGVCRHNGHYSNDLDRDNVSHLDALWRREDRRAVISLSAVKVTDTVL